MKPFIVICVGLALSSLAFGQQTQVPSTGNVLDLLQDPKYQPFIQIVSDCFGGGYIDLLSSQIRFLHVLTRGAHDGPLSCSHERAFVVCSREYTKYLLRAKDAVNLLCFWLPL